MDFKKERNIIMVVWGMLIVANIIVYVLWHSPIAMFLIGLNSGCLIVQLINNPLIDSYDRLIECYKKLVESK